MSVEKENIVQSICSLLCEQNLGLLCNSQLRIIDTLIHQNKKHSRERILAELEKHRVVVDLATAISYAVDANKTGKIPRLSVPAVYEKWDPPDFMKRERKGFYTSESILGKLYRATDDYS